MITARDIAAELGIASSTVGRALSDDTRISAETKARVREVADRLGYVGNIAAQMMRGVPSKLVGLMIPDVANDFYAAIGQVLSSVADERGYRLILFLTGDDPAVEARQVRELIKIRASGLIMVPTSAPTAQTCEFARRLQVTQLLRYVPALGSSWFGMDDRFALHSATRFLIDHGHREIAYLGGSETVSTGAHRLAGVRSAFAEAGIAETSLTMRLDAPTRAFGYAATCALLDSAQKPTAILTGSAHITIGVIGALSERRIRVPQDLSLVGFGNALWYQWWQGGITVVAPAVTEIARDCGLQCIDRIEAVDKDAPTMASGWPSTLIERRSVAKI